VERTRQIVTEADPEEAEFDISSCWNIWEQLDDTVDGQNPAPPRMMIIPLFTRFFLHPRWLFGISAINSINTFAMVWDGNRFVLWTSGVLIPTRTPGRWRKKAQCSALFKCNPFLFQGGLGGEDFGVLFSMK